jgi:hypothetical protein
LGENVDLAGQDHLMASHPIGPRSATQAYPSSAACNRAYTLAAMRAGLIALVLLAILALVIIF